MATVNEKASDVNGASLDRAKMGIEQAVRFVKADDSETVRCVVCKWLWQPKEIDGCVQALGDKLFTGELLDCVPPIMDSIDVECIGERVYAYAGIGKCQEEDGDASRLAYFLNGTWWKCKRCASLCVPRCSSSPHDCSSHIASTHLCPPWSALR